MKNIYYVCLAIVVVACRLEPDALLGGGNDSWNSVTNTAVTQTSGEGCRYRMTEVDDNKANCEKPDLENHVYDILEQTPVNGGREILWKFKKMSGSDGFPVPKNIEFIRYPDNHVANADLRVGACGQQSAGSNSIDDWGCRVVAKNKLDEGYYYRLNALVMENAKCGRVVRYEAVANADCSYDWPFTHSPVYVDRFRVPMVLSRAPLDAEDKLLEDEI